MAAIYGITVDGFIPKPIDEIKAELEADLQGVFGAGIDLSPQSNFGQLVGVMADALADAWNMGQDVYAAFTPDSSTGVSEDNVCAITGTLRLQATPSTATVTATGTPGTVLNASRVVSVLNTGVRFTTDISATITAAAAWAATHAYLLGDRVANGSRIYQCLGPGVSAGSGGPSGTGHAIGDGGVTWRYVGDGTGVIDVTATAEVTGPNPAPADTLATIETPVSGWSTVTNLLDGIAGTNQETDSALRIRREQDLRANGFAAIDAIRALLLEVAGVTAATVFVNFSDVTDSDGLPPHSIEALVQGGVDAAIRAEIWKAIGGGIRPYGTTTGTIIDSAGVTHEVDFTRPTLKNVWVTLTVAYDASLYPTDGDNEVKAQVVLFGGQQKAGKDVVASAQAAQAFKVPGVLDATALISFSVTPTLSITLPIAPRELAVFDTSRIVVNSSPAVP